MSKVVYLAVVLGIATLARGADATPLEKYEVLSGEGFAGSGFVIHYDNGFLGVASLHQFDGKTPRTLEPLEGDEVVLDPTKVIKQKDVQALPVKSPSPKLQFLKYNPDFTLRAGDEVIILGPAGDRVQGVLAANGMTDGAYKSADGPRNLEAKVNNPFMMAGGSGGPILHKKSGAVIGVLLTADDAKQARVVGFETLCLADTANTPLAQYRKTVSVQVGARWNHYIQKNWDTLKAGSVSVSLTIDAKGKLQGFRVTENTSNLAHAKLIEQCANESEFDPPPSEILKEGVFEYPMRFDLK